MSEVTPIEAVPVEQHKEAVAEATSEERERARDARIEALETRINSLPRHDPPVTPASPTFKPPEEPSAPLSTVEALTEKVEHIATVPAAVTEPVSNVVDGAVDTTGGAIEEAEDVIEILPRRTHSLFKSVFGRRE